MTDPSPKRKMISVRLSAEEYAALHTVYASYGARNVSDLARLAMQRFIVHPHVSDSISVAKIRGLDDRLSAVEKRLALLFALEKEMA
jgi:hypothetical protein